MSEIKKIIFVDDDTNILNGLKRGFRSKRKIWDMTFVDNGNEALKYIDEQEYDVLVTDMMMPNMDGATLLEKARELQPNMVRFILSGHSDNDMVFRAINNAHQFLSKPCDIGLLMHKLERALLLSDTISNKGIKSAISSIGKLPALPETYKKLQILLRSNDVSVPEVGKIIAQDLSMSSQLLKLVNSAFFGLGRKVLSPEQATTILGIDAIKALVLSVGIFEQVSVPSSFKQVVLWEHSFKVANLAKKIAQESGENTNKVLVDESYLAGMLHDFGQLILAVNSPELYDKQELLLEMNKNFDPLFIEMHLFNASHAHVGAYLFGLWGLSSSLVEAVAFHHEPELIEIHEFSPLVAVYLAEYFINQAELPNENNELAIDIVQRFFSLEQLDEFRKESLRASGNVGE